MVEKAIAVNVVHLLGVKIPIKEDLPEGTNLLYVSLESLSRTAVLCFSRVYGACPLHQ